MNTGTQTPLTRLQITVQNGLANLRSRMTPRLIIMGLFVFGMGVVLYLNRNMIMAKISADYATKGLKNENSAPVSKQPLGGVSGKPVPSALVGARMRPESASSIAKVTGLSGKMPVNTSHAGVNQNAVIHQPQLDRVMYNQVHEKVAKGPPVLDAIVDPNTDFINSAVFVNKRRGTAIHDIRGEAIQTGASTIAAPVPTWGPFDGGPHDDYQEPLDNKLPAQKQFFGGGAITDDFFA
jgi:hypothetical protein